MGNRFSWDTFTIMSNIFPGYYSHIKRMSSMKVMKMARFKTIYRKKKFKKQNSKIEDRAYVK